ncbi:hypothetical protein CHS0354_036079 [Potamilus streckersoni]|uniref:Peptidase M14 domain-containing protein n=1 Tax=Potamilus streckersoni TaxID=2493646 RepID=A0AAE0VM43_9BIVA|nr:hypothetical protein CHS0354_036079 [Potamilus streckersoni]
MPWILPHSATTRPIHIGPDDSSWRESIRQQMEAELNQRVREALETPPVDRVQRQNSDCSNQGSNNNLDQLNAHIILDLSEKERDYLKTRRWKALQAKRQMQKIMTMNYMQPSNSRIEFIFRDELAKSNQDEFPGVYGLTSFSEGVKDINEINRKSLERYPALRSIHRQFYTRDSYLTAIRTGKFPDGTPCDEDSNGFYVDKFGVIRTKHGPFWPGDVGPLFPTPKFMWYKDVPPEPLYFFHKDSNAQNVDNQVTPYTSKWRGALIVFDSERSSRDHFPQPVPEGCCPTLHFESRFESGNLRQARRVGQFEYELVLKTDLYTQRHTQWYYFRVQNVVPGITYRFRIVNLLKRDSLYNYGMRPLVYSEMDASTKDIGWVRAGHHVSYSRNVLHLHCPLLQRGIAYYELEWQMEFPNENDTYYLAHCYPYTFTDLKDDLENLLNDKQRQQFITREVLCETRAGNSCFLLTVTNFEQPKDIQNEKKAVVITARVHPGESQASWMMKGAIDYITGPDPEAQELRNRFIFKIVPMLNPDGVIVGNYRCSMAARDLNRNYRHPKKESFPTVWHTKYIIEEVLKKHEVILYCDLHGHSRKHNVFMYGNNTSTDSLDPDTAPSGMSVARAFLNERLFPWLMAQKAPEKFSFPFCKFHIRRCKEATGRVVMWRQMRIYNSFTLEATFSGTSINRENCRHFNIGDFMEMGKALCQSVLEYQRVQEDKAKHTEIILDLTRYLTLQVLQKKDANSNVRLPNLRAVARAERASTMPTTEFQDGTGQKMEDFPAEGSSDSDRFSDDGNVKTYDTDSNGAFEHSSESKGKKNKTSKDHQNSILSKMDINNILENASLKTMDGCLKLLAQLKVTETLDESDSSDSDSESEPELRLPETKPKKKKRKTKKQRDREQQERKGGSGSGDKKGSECKSNGKKEKGEKMGLPLRHVSKYEGRSNGGIPCFAEERSLERAAKRMAEMKKRTEEDKQKEMSFFSDQEGEHLHGIGCQHCEAMEMENYRKFRHVISIQSSNPPPLEPLDFPPSPSVIALQQRDSLPPRFIPPHPDKVHILSKFFDSFKDLTPSVHPAGAAQREQGSSSEESDLEMELNNGTTIPVAARSNPYQQDQLHQNLGMPHSAHALSGTNTPHLYKRHLSLKGPTMRAYRHLNSASGPVQFSTSMIRPESMMLQTPPIRSEEQRFRQPKHPVGPLDDESVPKVRGIRVPGHGE